MSLIHMVGIDWLVSNWYLEPLKRQSKQRTSPAKFAVFSSSLVGCLQFTVKEKKNVYAYICWIHFAPAKTTSVEITNQSDFCYENILSQQKMQTRDRERKREMKRVKRRRWMNNSVSHSLKPKHLNIMNEFWRLVDLQAMQNKLVAAFLWWSKDMNSQHECYSFKKQKTCASTTKSRLKSEIQYFYIFLKK